ncbi:MAG: hypothetical protein DMG65_07185 [Candidatus Angelobacter sp. Gp1-AA117]|nr:MAG: hypothetical protein DMG65_07185 [Candidatus Angelobacter sp. Gp1-AA117]
MVDFDKDGNLIPTKDAVAEINRKYSDKPPEVRAVLAQVQTILSRLQKMKAAGITFDFSQ